MTVENEIIRTNGIVTETTMIRVTDQIEGQIGIIDVSESGPLRK